MKTTPIPLMLFSNATVRAGAEEVVLQLLQGLDRKFFRLHLACTPELARLFQADLPSDVTVTPLCLDHLSDFRGAYELAHTLKRQRIQILHSHMFRASFFASPLARRLKVPVVLDTSHGREVWRKGLKSFFFVDRFVCRQVDRTIAVSHSTARYLIEAKGLPVSKIHVIHNAVNAQRYSRDPEAAHHLKHSLQIDADAPLLLVVGRLEPQKGHRILLQAMPAILSRFPKAHLVCLGEGSLQAQLQAEVNASGFHHAVTFLGYQPDVPRWLASADLTILPSLFEGLPMVAIESLASECPIVATAVDGTPEVVFDGITGLLVPPENPDCLARAILKLLSHPNLAHWLAQNGRNLILRNFTVETMVRRNQDLYLQLWERYATTAISTFRQPSAPSAFREAAPLPVGVAASHSSSSATKGLASSH
jgi:glycosyltransferase involved in cell wall biosynthesis